MSGSKGTVGIYKSLLSEQPDDLEALWLLNVAYMTLGKYPESVPKKMLIPNLDKTDETSIKAFEDIAPDLGLDVKNMVGGTIIEDYDNDGWLDILCGDYTMEHNLGYYAAAERLGASPQFHGQPVLYKNNHDGTFSNVTKALGLDKTAFGMGGKSFADVTASAKVGCLQKGHGVGLGDMDNDGDQDIGNFTKRGRQGNVNLLNFSARLLISIDYFLQPDSTGVHGGCG